MRKKKKIRNLPTVKVATAAGRREKPEILSSNGLQSKLGSDTLRVWSNVGD